MQLERTSDGIYCSDNASDRHQDQHRSRVEERPRHPNCRRIVELLELTQAQPIVKPTGIWTASAESKPKAPPKRTVSAVKEIQESSAEGKSPNRAKGQCHRQRCNKSRSNDSFNKHLTRRLSGRQPQQFARHFIAHGRSNR
jgi:hypothetical protein